MATESFAQGGSTSKRGNDGRYVLAVALAGGISPGAPTLQPDAGGLLGAPTLQRLADWSAAER